MTISPTEYLNPVRIDYDADGIAERGNGMCKVCIKQSWDTYWHIGTMALVDYYAEFDLDNRQMHITPLATGNKQEVTTGSTPDNILGVNFFTVLFLSSAIGVTIIATILLCMAVYCDNNLFPRLNPKQANRAVKEANVTTSQLEELIKNAIKRKQ